jgi:tetratricopeptide (TPR) repeat protein
LGNEPVLARPPSRLYEFQKTVRRHKFGFAAAGAVIVALSAGVVVSTWQAIRALRAKQEAQTEAAKSRQVSKFLEDTLGAAGPSVALGRDTTLLREILDRAAERVTSELKDQPLVAAELQVEIADVYVSLLDFAKGERLHRQALETRRKLLGPDHADIAYSLRRLANARRCQREHGEAEALVREATAMYRRLGHPDLAYDLASLAGSLVDQGKAEAAEIPNREAQELFRKASGDQKLNIATLVWQLGSIRRGEGRLAEAEQLMTEQLPILREVAGQDGVCFSLGELASLQMDRSEWPQAEATLKEQLAIAKHIFSGTHYNYLASPYRGLAQVLMHQGKLDEAESMQQQALTILRQAPPPEDLRLEIARANWELADIRRAQGRKDEADSLMLEQLPTFRKVASPYDLLNLAGTLVNDGKFEEADSLQQEALEGLRKTPGDHRLEIAKTLQQIANIRRGQGRKAEAEKLMLEQLPIVRELGTPEDLASSLDTLSWLFMEEGKIPNAEQMFRERVFLERRICGPNLNLLLNPLLGLANCLSAEGRSTESETFLREAAEIQRKLTTDQRAKFGMSGWLAQSMQAMGHLAEAKYWYRQVLLEETIKPTQSPDQYAQTVINLVTAYFPLKEFHELEVSYPEWLQQARARLPADHPALADILAQVVTAPLFEQNWVEAEKLGRECLTIREQKLPNDWRTYEARGTLGSCLVHQKRYAEAEPLLLSGCDGLKQHAAEIPDGWKPRANADLQQLVQLYEATDRSDQAAEWRKKLEEFEQAQTNRPPSAKPSP